MQLDITRCCWNMNGDIMACSLTVRPLGVRLSKWRYLSDANKVGMQNERAIDTTYNHVKTKRWDSWGKNPSSKKNLLAITFGLKTVLWQQMIGCRYRWI